MFRIILIATLVLTVTFCFGQKSRYDSIKKVLQQDSLEYEQDKKNAERIKNQADSMMRQELGAVETITPVDTAAMRRKLHQIAEQELQKREEEAKKNYYLYVGAFAILVIAVIILFKRKQFAEADKKKP